jgi:ketosteroid isomerase-like protein
MTDEQTAQEHFIRKIFEAFAVKDLDTVRDSFHPDVSFELPFEDRFTGRFGKAAVVAHFEMVFDPAEGLFTEQHFEIDAIHVSTDLQTVVVQCRSAAILREFSAPYENSYVSVFALRDGLVHRWQEYANPLKGTSRRLEQLRSAT